VKPEVMIPLVGFKKELDLQVEVVHRVAKEVMAETKGEARLPGRHDD
jgi:pyruvate, orthophosphate dikinase